jgi:microcystin-dependent protein
MADFKIGEDYIVDKTGYAQSYPVGSVIIIMSSTIPDGWLLCDGRPANTFTYQELHKVISNTYGGTAYSLGTTDQSGVTTTFNLPPLVVNATYNPTGRFAVSRQSSEPSYPANFSHNHTSYKANATAYGVFGYGTGGDTTKTHVHANMNIDSSSVGYSHNHANMAGGNVLNNVTSNSASSRQSSANNAVEYHNVPVHDHGGTSTAALTMANDIHTNGGHSHTIQVHSADTISHTHTVTQNTNVTISGSTFQGITSGASTNIPLSKEVYFIIKY